MELTKETLPKSRVKLTIKVTPTELRAIFKRVYDKIAPTIEIKGFRPGAAPKTMIIQAIGENRLQSEVVDAALQETYPEALKKENIVPVSQPVVNIKMMKDLLVDTAELEYEAEVDIFPVVTLGDYKKIRVKKEGKEIAVTDDEVDQVLSHLARGHATFLDIDRAVKEGDRVEMNFNGYEKGVLLENLSSKNYPVILGSKVLIPEFEKEIYGMKKGDKKEFTVKMAAGPDQPKKPVDFKVEILLTQEVILPEQNDEYAKKFQKENMTELKKAIKEDIVKQKGHDRDHKLENDILEKLLEIVKVDLPVGLIDQEVERQINDMKARTGQMGLTFEQYLANLKKTEDEFKEALKPQAEKTIKIGLGLGEIVKQEKIDIKNKDAGKLALEHLIALATK